MAFCSSLPCAAKLVSPSAPRRSLTPAVLGVTPAPLHFKSTARPGQKSRLRIVTRAEESSTPDVDAIVKDLTEKWDKVENKSSIAIYGVGAIAVLYVTSSVVGAVNAIPLLPKFLELVGFIYTSWFVYRYLLFKSSREELSKDVDELKSKITGQQNKSEF